MNVQTASASQQQEVENIARQELDEFYKERSQRACSGLIPAAGPGALAKAVVKWSEQSLDFTTVARLVRGDVRSGRLVKVGRERSTSYKLA